MPPRSRGPRTNRPTAYAFAWDTTGVRNGSHALTAVARDAAGNTSTSLPVSVTVSNPDTLPPSLPTGLTATADSASQITLAWSPAADNVGVTGYQVFRNGVQIGIASGSSYQDTGLSPVTVYTYTVAAFDAAGNTSGKSFPAAATTLAVQDTTPPTVSITAPTAGTALAGTVTVAAGATDDVGVVGVQFKLDGASLGSENTTAPYRLAWDTTGVPNGAHTLTAAARWFRARRRLSPPCRRSPSPPRRRIARSPAPSRSPQPPQTTSASPASSSSWMMSTSAPRIRWPHTVFPGTRLPSGTALTPLPRWPVTPPGTRPQPRSPSP